MDTQTQGHLNHRTSKRSHTGGYSPTYSQPPAVRALCYHTPTSCTRGEPATTATKSTATPLYAGGPDQSPWEAE